MAWKDLTPKTFASIRELNGISQRTQEEHYELYKAELAIRFGRSYEQDGPF